MIEHTHLGAGATESDLISIVVPAHNESGNLPVLAGAVSAAMGNRQYELIIVDDGSSDDTFARVEELARHDPRVRGISLSRNFGHQHALAAGLRHARGAAVITMDADMQHPPEILPSLIDRWRTGYRVVQGVREDTKRTGLFKRLTSRAFYRVFSGLCGIRVESGMSDFRLVDRAVVNEVNALSEGDLFLRGLLAWMGYRRADVPFRVGQRHSGSSKYGLRRMAGLATTGILAFSSVPLRLGVGVGLVMSLLSFGELAYVLYAYLSGQTVAGWASIVAVMSFLFAVLFLLVGIQGEYIIRIYERVQRRPPFVIERTCGWDPSEGKRP